jgi:hypothetical protein
MSEIALLREALEDHRRELARLRRVVKVAHAEVTRGRYVSVEWKLRSALSEPVAPPEEVHFSTFDRGWHKGYRAGVEAAAREGERIYLANPKGTGRGVLMILAEAIRSLSPPAPPVPDSAYDMSIHSNRDAGAWARAFVQTWGYVYPNQPAPSESWILGWFANAMMAMHDTSIDGRARPAPVDPPRGGCKHLRTETDHGKPWTCLDCGRIYAGILSKWVDPPAPEPEERCPECAGAGVKERMRSGFVGASKCRACGGTGLAPGKGDAK